MFLRIVISLFFVVNPVGNIPVFVSLLKSYKPKRQIFIILREFAFATSILLIFNFFGEFLLDLIGISAPVVGIAGGAVLFLIAISMVFPNPNAHQFTASEPFIVPLATPVTAGPGSITSVMIFSQQATSPHLVTAAIAIVMAASLLLTLGASHFKHLLGDKGLVAVERLGGMVLTIISVQMITGGVVDLVKLAFF